jgi:hypothetical protein
VLKYLEEKKTSLNSEQKRKCRPKGKWASDMLESPPPNLTQKRRWAKKKQVVPPGRFRATSLLDISFECLPDLDCMHEWKIYHKKSNLSYLLRELANN